MNRVVLIALVATVAACAAAPAPLTDVLDETSGTGHLRPLEPLRFAAARPGLVATGGDFVYFSPLLVNRRGQSRHFFWVAPASTVDRPLAGLRPVDVIAVTVLLDGVPMALDLRPWAEVSPVSPFEVGMFRHGEYAARASASQIARVAAAGTVELRLVDGEGRARRFTADDQNRSAWAALGPATPAAATEPVARRAD
ncbi:MAG: hypothetical protein AAFX58_10210 [Pseudomonadota bacterium]